MSGVLNLNSRRAIALLLPVPQIQRYGQAVTCPKSCPKTATYRCRRCLTIGGLGAIGGHNSNLKIDLAFYRGCRRHPHIGTRAVARAPESFADSEKETP